MYSLTHSSSHVVVVVVDVRSKALKTSSFVPLMPILSMILSLHFCVCLSTSTSLG